MYLRLATALGLLAAPPLCHLLHVDLLALALLVAVTAGLFRSPLGLIDRLVLAAGLLAGWVCLLGVLASVWPWGLQPVALGEATALLPAAALLAGRRLRLPRPRWRDAQLLLPIAAAAFFYLQPLLATDATGRFARVYHGEDLARHFALYDSVLRLQGYLVFHRAEAAVALQNGFQSYPQGSHLTLAVLTEYAFNGHPPAAATTTLDHFVLLVAGVLTAFVGSVAWAARRVAGPLLGRWGTLPVAGLVVVYLVAVEATPIALTGFESELFGLTLLTLLAALVLRPLARPAEQALLLGALTIGISFAYYLLLAAAGPLLLVWLLARRRRLPRPAVLAAAALLTAAGAALPVVANWQQANSATVLVMPGGVVAVSRHLLVPLAVFAVLGLLTRPARRNADRRAALAALAAVAAVATALMAYQLSTVGKTSYYYEKLLHPVVVLAVLAAAAALGPLLGRPRLDAPRALLATAAAATVLLYNAQPDWATTGGWQGSYGAHYRSGRQAAPASAELVTAIAASRPVPDRYAAVVLTDPHAKEDPRFLEGSLWTGVLNRDNGRSWQAWIWGRWRRWPHEIVEYADASPVPLHVYLSDPATVADTLALRDHPERLAISLVSYDPEGRPIITGR
ncbi:hypothetical protein CFP65_2848 [Kitasatospora sp. MMS16-BH015]|uniref:hypothetical protein n=1 Tax=Kitasatospora sp. MMS16-BH015 TaxID=2018025 RepID=UPI000CA1453E|nr:hypothetical protein [Kitasatospora sp. MMS16-BH015]AUG77664.1 hypothetical protein CFP65_2848 [Kitasatospora sp. MMS16-BH015]